MATELRVEQSIPLGGAKATYTVSVTDTENGRAPALAPVVVRDLTPEQLAFLIKGVQLGTLFPGLSKAAWPAV